ncbi:uncharacterized protein LOC117117505 [Anneissia japonica]|uniref:uncharacterized protein LOC117117505 n=1 Tax=Anneissia japonica TaxID=1529436 RepID=UPI001425525B|nr:uncharacterized protein LOC117117505 [Anneissia japonica]
MFEGTYQARMPYIVPKAIDNGIDPMAAATGFSIFGASGIVGRLFQLLVNAITNCNAMSIFFFALCLNCVSNLLLSLTAQYSWYILALIFDGVSYGLLLPYAFAILRQLSGHRLLAIASGWGCTLIGVMSVIWGVLYGRFYYIFGSYQEVFLWCFVMECISVKLVLLSRPLRVLSRPLSLLTVLSRAHTMSADNSSPLL